MIRAAAILQLLLGNVGRPGGGVVALRGHASIQGSTDIPTLYDLLPGYLHMPRAREQELTLRDYVDTGGADRGWWSHFRQYIVSLLKAWFGDAATPENDFGFGHLPKITGNHSHFPTMLRALDGGLDGLFVMGQNPAVGSEHSGLQRRALASLKWLVVRDLAEIETARFWKDGPEVRSGELRTEDIAHRGVPDAGRDPHREGGLLHQHRAARPVARQGARAAAGLPLGAVVHGPPVQARARALRRLAPTPATGRSSTSPGTTGEDAEPSADAVLREINGYDLTTGELGARASPSSRPTAATACGCWIYSGVYADGVNQARRREPGDLAKPGGWVVARVGLGVAGQPPHALLARQRRPRAATPWSERKRYVWWDAEQERWTGYDVPDFPVDKRPDYVAPPDGKGMDAISGSDPFIMQADGRGWLFAPAGLLDGPLPTHYEPLESPVDNALYPRIAENPAALRWDRADNPYAEPGDPHWPCVATTFRLTEHHTAGGMSRWLPWLAELQPEMFAEIDPQLARERGIEDGGWLTISSPRGEIEARAKVTDRIKPLQLGDRRVHQVGAALALGLRRPVAGRRPRTTSTSLSGDPNVSIQESKAFVCEVRAGRSQAGTAKLAGVHERPPGVAPDRDHPAEHRPHR